MKPETKADLLFVLAVVIAVLWVVGSAAVYVPKLYICLGCGVVAYGYWAIRRGRSHWAKIEYDNKKYEKAIELCEKQTSAFPQDQYPRVLAAYSAYALKDYDRAIDYASRAIDLGGKLENLFLLRAEANLFSGKYEQCRTDATQAMKFGKTSWVAHWLRANAFFQQYEYEQALNDAEAPILLQTRPEFACLIKAHIYFSRNQNIEAMREVASVLINGNAALLPSALQLRALINCRLGNLDLSVDDLDQVLELKPDSAEVHINRCYILGRKGDLDSAFISLILAKERELKVRHGYVESNEARIQLLSGNTERALECSSQAVKIGPERSALNSTHGLMLLRNNRLEEGKSFLDLAIEQDSYEAEAYYFRAELHEKMGNIEEAEKDKKIALDFSYIPYL